MRKKTARHVLDRLKLVFEAKSDSQLSELLGEGRSTVGSWVARDSVPYALCVEVAEQRGLSLDWLLTGEGPKTRSGEWAGTGMESGEEDLLAVVRALDDPARQAVRQFAEERMTLLLVSRQMQALNEVLQTWAESEGKSASAVSGHLMDGVRDYLALTAQIDAKVRK